jgi:hypothetical protein
MVSPWVVRGLFRVKGDPNLVQVQFGPFSRPVTEQEYKAAVNEPPLEELPWKGERTGHDASASYKGPALWRAGFTVT